MTLTEALTFVHPWLGTWTPNSYDVTQWPHRLLPMPPATDELAMQVLRKLHQESLAIRLHGGYAKGGGSWEVFIGLEDPAEADDPRDAIILAAAQWLQESGIP